MREMLATWAERVRDGATEEEFVDAERARLAERVGESGDDWQLAAPLWQSLPRASSATGEEARTAEAAS